MSTGNTEDPPGLGGEAPARGEDPDAWLDEWVAMNLAYLSALYEPPWNDAKPEGEKISDEEKNEAA